MTRIRWSTENNEMNEMGRTGQAFETGERDEKGESTMNETARSKVTLATVLERKQQNRPVAMATAYDYAMAQLLEEAGVDSILVGDSLAQVVLGHATTLSVGMELMIALTAAVRRGAPHVWLVGDMPFLSYQVSREEAIRNAGRFLSQAGCDIVKLEVNSAYADDVAALARAGIPVMAHLGIHPQRIHQKGAFRAEARQADAAMGLVSEVDVMIEAGASAILLECVAREVAAEISRRSRVPVISCGSGPGCDGQVVVLHDLLGLPGESGARFTRRYADLGEQVSQAMAAYVADVHESRFPSANESYSMTEQQRQLFYTAFHQGDNSGG